MEIWDLLDEKGQITGRRHVRGEPLGVGEYHRVVHIWPVNEAGLFLCQQRAWDLVSFPGVWAGTGGSVIQGEDSLQGALREVREELGVRADPAEMRLIHSEKRKSDFLDIWILRCEIDITKLPLPTTEVIQVRWVNLDELSGVLEVGGMMQDSCRYVQLLRNGIEGEGC